MNAVVLGLSESKLGDVLIAITKAESTVVRTENTPPSIVVHPFMLITAILNRFSEEDGMFINKIIDRLRLLQHKISADEALSMGNLSIELNQLSSDLRAIQMGNVYMQSLTRAILVSPCTIKHSNNTNCSLAALAKDSVVVDSKKVGSENEAVKRQWGSLVGQFTQIISDLEALGVRCEGRKFDIECLQKQIDINLNVVSIDIDTHHKIH